MWHRRITSEWVVRVVPVGTTVREEEDRKNEEAFSRSTYSHKHVLGRYYIHSLLSLSQRDILTRFCLLKYKFPAYLVVSSPLCVSYGPPKMGLGWNFKIFFLFSLHPWCLEHVLSVCLSVRRLLPAEIEFCARHRTIYVKKYRHTYLRTDRQTRCAYIRYVRTYKQNRMRREDRDRKRDRDRGGFRFRFVRFKIIQFINSQKG